jgi:hypothetical protein
VNEHAPNLHHCRLPKPSRDGSDVRLDADGDAAVQDAIALAGDAAPGPLHLLRVLAAPGTSSATMLRQLGVQLDLRDFPPDAADLEAIIRQARIEAGTRRSRYAGRRHLLLAAAGAATGELRSYLEKMGVTPRRLHGVMERPRECLAGDPAPSGINLVGALMVIHGLTCVCAFPALGADGVILGVLNGAWSMAAGIALGFVVPMGHRWAWSCALGYLSIRSLSLLAFSGWLLASGTWGAIPILAVGIVTGSLAGTLIEHRRWFGVPDREVLRTLWREGAWTIVPTLALDLATILLAWRSTTAAA